MDLFMLESISRNLHKVKDRRLWAAFDPCQNLFVKVNEKRSIIAHFVEVSNLAVDKVYRHIEVRERPYFFVVRFDASLIGEKP